MNDNLTEIVAILDRSGSMSTLVDDTIGGFNTFLEQQKELDGEANLTLVLFDDQYEMLYDNINIKDVKELTRKEYNARGMTALLDAVGKTINSVGARLARMKEEDRPGKVIFLITTDGYENSSAEFTSDNIKEMVKTQEDVYNWEFIFLGANIDAFGEGGKMGYNFNSIASFDASSKGVNVMYSALSRTVSDTRSGIDKKNKISMSDYVEQENIKFEGTENN